MKYSKPEIEISKLETTDIMESSSEGSLTVGGITITGPNSSFITGFDELRG